MDDRQKRIEAYLKDFEALDVESQRQHYSIALLWIVRALLDSEEPPSSWPPQERFQQNE